MKTQLLCTFTRKHQLEDTLDDILDSYDVLYDKIFVLSTDNPHEVVCSYNIAIERPVQFLQNTISVHRKKETNTIYTINALNELILTLNNGVLNTRYPVDWEHYRNMILVTNDRGLRRIKTAIVEVVKI